MESRDWSSDVEVQTRFQPIRASYSSITEGRQSRHCSTTQHETSATTSALLHALRPTRQASRSSGTSLAPEKKVLTLRPAASHPVVAKSLFAAYTTPGEVRRTLTSVDNTPESRLLIGPLRPETWRDYHLGLERPEVRAMSLCSAWAHGNGVGCLQRLERQLPRPIIRWVLAFSWSINSLACSYSSTVSSVGAWPANL